MSKLRQKILGATDISSERVRIEEWDVDIEVRAMTGEQRDRVSKASRDEDGKLNETRFATAIIIECSLDPETKEQIFGDADRDALMQKSGAALDRLAGVALRLSGLTKEAKDAARKNSKASDGSTSGSPNPSDAPSPSSSSESAATN